MIFILLLLAKFSNAQTSITNNNLLNLALNFSKTSAVTGREEEGEVVCLAMVARTLIQAKIKGTGSCFHGA